MVERSRKQQQQSTFVEEEQYWQTKPQATNEVWMESPQSGLYDTIFIFVKRQFLMPLLPVVSRHRHVTMVDRRRQVRKPE